MMIAPFRMFDGYNDVLDIHLFAREDAIDSDEKIADALQTKNLVSLKQVHGKKTVILREPSRRIIEADGVWTDEKDLTLTIRVADCQALVAYDPKNQIIGILHAGWKGLVNGAIKNFIAAYEREWKGNPNDLIVGIAPCLCVKCAEFTDPTRELIGIDPQFFHGRNADLRAIADSQLMAAGIQKSHIERLTDCTKCENEKWWSYRGGDKEKVMKGSTNVMTCRLK